MEAMIIGAPWQARPWREALEGDGEAWRCEASPLDSSALHSVHAGRVHLLILTPCEASARMLEALSRTAPLQPPFVAMDGTLCPGADFSLSAHQAFLLPGMLEKRLRQGELPLLARQHLPRITRLSAALLRALGLSPRLRAAQLLPDMLALCVLYPPLLDSVTYRLYPAVASRWNVTPACVERRLRLAVESTWNHASMDALERFFGQSVDPARGKPTNREFLCRMQERLLLSASSLVT